MRTIKEIIIHCSATPEGRHITAQQIDQWHRAQGWNGIAYNYVIYLDGTIVIGRPENTAGAHTRDHNRISIGICYIGGVDAVTKKPKDTRTPAQRQALIKLVKDLRERYPLATVHGHNEFAPKACPSFNVQAEPDLCGK